MTDVLAHRGPDDAGYWVDEQAGVGLGNRRLAIVDLSPTGRQPMESSCGRYVLSFNGEIYNFRPLRDELQRGGRSFRGHSDTEMIVEAVSEWGLRESVERFNGMFALAVWDRQDAVLHLARDRIGKKPLYYSRTDKTLVFGSELKALREHPDFDSSISRDSLLSYLHLGYVPGPSSIFKKTAKLLPGSIFSVKRGFPRESDTTYTYWSAGEAFEDSLMHPFEGDLDEAAAELEILLRDAVGIRMIADVPLGAFLSGGIDSSVIVALMQAQSTRPIQTFSIGFKEKAFDESRRAADVAHRIGTDHTELIVSPTEAMSVIPRLPAVYDEPFADSSQIPTLLVSELASNDVKVALSGDGGDELFIGYDRYAQGRRLARSVTRIPRPVRSAASGALRSLSIAKWDRLLDAMAPALPRRLRSPGLGSKVHKFARALALRDARDTYASLLSKWSNPQEVVVGEKQQPASFDGSLRIDEKRDFIQGASYLDAISYLPDDILVKMDRATMAVSLEARAPLLDHRVVAFAWSLPLDLKVSGGVGKRVLRKVLENHLPEELARGPKRGFGVPIAAWLKGPLKGWAELLLDEGRLRSENIFESELIRAKWDEHIAGKRDWSDQLWTVLMFQAWLDGQRLSHPTLV